MNERLQIDLYQEMNELSFPNEEEAYMKSQIYSLFVDVYKVDISYNEFLPVLEELTVIVRSKLEKENDKRK